MGITRHETLLQLGRAWRYLRRRASRWPGRELLSGLSIGDAVVTGRVCLIESARDIGHAHCGHLALVTIGLREGGRINAKHGEIGRCLNACRR